VRTRTNRGMPKQQRELNKVAAEGKDFLSRPGPRAIHKRKLPTERKPYDPEVVKQAKLKRLAAAKKKKGTKKPKTKTPTKEKGSKGKSSPSKGKGKKKEESTSSESEKDSKKKD